MREFAWGRPDAEPFFTPWIGQRYAERLMTVQQGDPSDENLHRLHLMGESHYFEPNEEPQRNSTISAVTNLALEPNKYGAFWTKAIQIAASRPSWEIDRRAAWGEVAYSNYMQLGLSQPRQAVPQGHWDSGARAFFAQLAITRPTVLAVLSKRTFSMMPNEGMRVPWPLSMQPDWEPVEDAWLYGYETPVGRQLTVAVSVAHPSSFGFSWEKAARRAWSAMAAYDKIVAAFEEGRLKPHQNA